MSVYSSGGDMPSSSHPQRLKNQSPKRLQIRKTGPSRRPINFSELSTPDGISGEDFVSNIRFKFHNIPTAPEAATIDEVAVSDLIKKAENYCVTCREPIGGSDPRYVRMECLLPSVGAEISAAGGFKVESICQSCHGSADVPTITAAPQSESWKQQLKPRQREIWDLAQQDLTQQVIAGLVGLSQAEVSKTLQACKRIRDSAANKS